MGKQSKTKGASAERELAKYLSSVFGGSFIRSNNSGAMIGGANAFRKASLSEGQIINLKGDIVPPDHMPRFVIESKFYADFRFHQLLQPGPVPTLDTWIDQVKQTVDEGDFWVVIFKINLRGWFICVPEAFCEKLVFDNHCLYRGQYGAFRVTEMKGFIEANRDTILELTLDR